MDIERERFETETDLENLLFDKTVEFRKSLREPVSVKRFPYGWRKEVPFLLANGCYAATDGFGSVTGRKGKIWKRKDWIWRNNSEWLTAWGCSPT